MLVPSLSHSRDVAKVCEDGLSEAVYPPLRTPSPASTRSPLPTERLEEMLAEEAQQADRLHAELRARDLERWQLLQLLHEKDERLARDERIAVKNRAAHAVTRATARRWRAVCALRAWREYVCRAHRQRAVARSRLRATADQITHACLALRVALRALSHRRLAEALHTLATRGLSDEGVVEGYSPRRCKTEDEAYATPRPRSPPTSWRKSIGQCSQSPCSSQRGFASGQCTLSEASTQLPSLAATPMLDSSSGVLVSLRSSRNSNDVLCSGCARGLAALRAEERDSVVAAARLSTSLSAIGRRQLCMAWRNFDVRVASRDAALRAIVQDTSDESERHTEEQETVIKLEARLARDIVWRSEAEVRIREMVQCGETLERDKAALRRQLADSRREQAVTYARVGELERAFERESEICHLLRIRAEKADAERLRLVEQETLHQGEIKAVRQVEEASRRQCLSDFKVQEEHWARTRESLATRAADALAELSGMQRGEARVLEEAFHNGQKQEAVAMKEVAGMDFASKEALSSEMAACGEMAARLRVRLTEVDEAEQAFQLQTQASTAASSTAPSGPPTPRLRELDAYAELVDRLRKEISREREEREATQRNLASLRSSYRLLLQRSGAAATCSGTR